MGEEGDHIEVGFRMGIEDCFAVEQVDVTESDTTVDVDIYVPPRDPAQTCIELAEARSADVRLKAPLGSRVLEIGGVAVTG